MTATIFAAAFLGCLLAIAVHVMFVRTAIAPLSLRRAKRQAEERPRVIECDPSEQEAITAMLDADQALKIAALDFGEHEAKALPADETGSRNAERLMDAALVFAAALPDANKARIRDHRAFEVKGRPK